MKELELEKKLNQIIGEWKYRTFTLEAFKGRGELLLNVSATMKTTSQLEDSLMVLASLSSSRYDEDVLLIDTDVDNRLTILENNWISLIQNFAETEKLTY